MKRENPSLKGTLGNVRSRRRRRRVKRSAFQTHKSFLVKKFCSEPEKKVSVRDVAVIAIFIIGS